MVGHSSGEIAAAYCADSVSMEDAIKAAFYRGQATLQPPNATERHQGMLAVGLGAQKLSKYLDGLDSPVDIACYNSPSSITLSGRVGTLSLVEYRLRADGHFARRLHVNLAYHSRYVVDIAEAYKSKLEQDYQRKSFSECPIAFFSSVSGRRLDRAIDPEYWRKNMTSPVYFDQAIPEMTSGPTGANFLIEIGPSGALAGPISQIKSSLPQKGSNIQYHPAFRRSQVDLRSLYEVAGQLFIFGGKVDMAEVNRQKGHSPRLIIDLPNYVWNHSEPYWYESMASKDWRFRLFPPHDLIGSKILGTSWHAPTWKKDLRLDDIPWLKDHKVCEVSCPRLY